MKKLFLASALALFGAMNAQQGFEGKSFIMGNVSYKGSTDNATDAKTNEFTILPAIGHFVAPTVAIGAGIGFTSSKTEVPATTTLETTVSQFVFQPLIRKYWTLGDKLYFFGQLAVPMAWGKTKNEVTFAGTSATSETKTSTYGVTVAPGLDYFLSEKWSVEASIGAFGYQTTKPKGGKSTDDFNFGVNTQNLTLGVKYVF